LRNSPRFSLSFINQDVPLPVLDLPCPLPDDWVLSGWFILPGKSVGKLPSNHLAALEKVRAAWPAVRAAVTVRP